MALNRDFIGRVFPPSEPYEVSRHKIKEFVDAIGDQNPIHRDPEAAKAAGYSDVIAPPTFPVIITLDTGVHTDPELGLDMSLVLHTEERFEHHRPMRAGDVVICESTVTGIRAIGRNERLEIKTEVRTTEGEPVCTVVNVLIERGGAA